MIRSTPGAAPVRARPAHGGRTRLLTSGRSLGLELLAGVGASLCCLPAVLLLAGVGGAWMGTLTALEPYRPYLMGLAIIFLGLAFRKLYAVSEACADEAACGTPRTLRRQRALYRVVTAAVALLVALPWYAPYLTD